MKATLIGFQILNLLSITSAIVFSVRNQVFKNELKYLSLIPFLSLIQIIISELITLVLKKPSYLNYNNFLTSLNLNLYVVFECTLIMLFLLDNYKKKTEKKLVRILVFLSIFSLFFENIFYNKSTTFSIVYFHIGFGLFLEIVLLIYLINSLKEKTIEDLFSHN